MRQRGDLSGAASVSFDLPALIDLGLGTLAGLAAASPLIWVVARRVSRVIGRSSVAARVTEERPLKR